MSPHLDINFEDVPDEITPVEPGIYVAKITEIPEIQPTADGRGEKIVVAMQIDEPNSPQHERRIQDHISLKAQTQIKRLAKSAGLTPGDQGLDLDDLYGKTIKIKVKSRTYTDPDSGEQRSAANVSDYLFDQE